MRRHRGSEKGFSTPGTLLAVVLAGTALAGSYICSEGLIRVSVQEKRPDGDHIRLLVPGVVVPAAMAFVPAREIGERLPPEAREFLPLARVAIAELRKLPDTTLVRVEGPDEKVRVRIEGGTLTVDVDSDDAEVHVTVPTRVMDSVMAKLAAAAERAEEGGKAPAPHADGESL